MPKLTTPTARERVLFSYYQPLDINEEACKYRQQTPQLSTDPCLTAFAQLGALRLNARRGIISLSSRDSEYILAESGQTILLQQDNDENDALWHGTSTIAASKGLGLELMTIFCDAQTAPSHVVVSDVREDDRFKHYGVVTGPPFVRFLAAVPLRTPSGSVVIGNYIVVDDKPRDGLSEKEIQFMVDAGVTVMDYLEAARVNQKEHRAQRMVKAISLFIEGKSTLRDWWLQEGMNRQKTRVKKRPGNANQLDGQADSEFGVQDPPDDYIAKVISIQPGYNHRDALGRLERSRSSSTISQIVPGDGRPQVPRTASSSSTLPQSPGALTTPDGQTSITASSPTDDASIDLGVKHYPLAFDNPDPNGPDESRELQETLLSNDLKNIFARASNLIREARSMDGTIFFDASVGSFGAASKKGVMELKAPGTFSIDAVISNNEEELVSKTSDTDGSTAAEEPAERAGNRCNILGYSTRHRSSLLGHTPLEESQSFPESILRRLLKRYPHGKVFNFDEDGTISLSDEYSERANNRPRKVSETSSRRRRLSREAEAAEIRRALPGARSVFWFPLWDQGRDRWYAGAMVWSTCPTRNLCPFEDLTYLAAFGNSIMAEVARFSARVLAQMKNDFISSISHELRSPLHGVLASVEFLQETPMTEMQTEMVDNIHASGKVLLDTINHLLDFSKVNRKSKNKTKSSRRSLNRRKKSNLETSVEEGQAEDAADICILSEEVVESIYAGRKASKLISDASGGRRTASSHITINSGDVTVITDMEWRANWTFDIDAGAWRRILMNLFSNAMKYTSTGFVKVSLRLDEDSEELNQICQPVLTLQVRDSGKGISKEFLENNLYKPFTQEDSLATGTGLGLSIVHHIIHDLGGHLGFVSEQGTGTEATVRVPLRAPRLSGESGPWDMIQEVRQKTAGMKVSFDGFDRLPDITETPTGILSPEAEGAMLLKASIQNLLVSWFSMDVTANADLGSSGARVDVLMESGMASMENKLQSYTWNALSEPMIVIILCSGPPKSKIRSNEFFRVHYIQQPYGPHKMAKVLHNAFCNDNSAASNAPAVEPNGISQLPKDPLQQMPNGNKEGLPPKPDRRDFAQAVKSPESLTSSGAEPKNANRISESQQTDPTDHDDLHVLLVEDNTINLKLLVAYMRKLKLRHDTAINGLEALNTYKEAHLQRPFDVIFMDISMPVMSGIEATKHIRRHETENRLKPCVIIALTGAANPEARQEAFSSGVDLFLTKPVPMKDLKVMLEELNRTDRHGDVGG